MIIIYCENYYSYSPRLSSLGINAVLNLLNVVPRAFHMEATPESTATVDALVDCTESQAEFVARKLERLTSIRDVVMKYTRAVS